MPFLGIKKLRLILIVGLFCIEYFQANAQRNSVQIILSKYIFENAPFDACHASTLAEIDKNSIISAWFGGKYEGSNDVSIWSSVSKDGNWSAPIEIANGIQNDSLRFPCWNPVLFKAKNGILYLHY